MFSLSASYLTDPLFSCVGKAATIDGAPITSSLALSPKLNYALLSSYLEFLSGLLTGVKWMCTLTRSELTDPIPESIEMWINQAVELLQGGLMVTINGVLATISTISKPDQWLLSTSASASTDSDRLCLALGKFSS